MAEIFDFLRSNWGLIMTIFAGAYSIIRLSMDSKYAKRSEIGLIDNGMDSNEKRISILENRLAALPDANEHHELKILLTKVNGSHSALAAEVRAMSRQVGLLIEKEVRK